ncbi:MAG: N-acetylmuramoyl-L-alanine amidase [Pseudomonadota bacterium]
MLVLHYTGMESGPAAEARLCDPASEVSAHYLVREDGVIVQMVAEAQRAWHAGVARWQGEGDLNSRSIGIEIVNGGHDFPDANGRLTPFPEVQISAVISLSRAVLARWPIDQTRIVGHSDIAPSRKRDPGEHFPWRRLSQEGVGLWPPEAPTRDGPPEGGAALRAGDTGVEVERMQAMLLAIGYDLSVTAAFDEAAQAAVRAFQRRWRPERVTGEADAACLDMIARVRAIYASAADGAA